MSALEGLYRRWGVEEQPGNKLSVSREVFETLICLALGRLQFSENDYLNRHDDVKQAIEAGQFGSGWQHFVWAGLMENRQLTDNNVNATEYRQMNPDLADVFAVDDHEGLVAHWRNVGWLEGRLRGPC